MGKSTHKKYSSSLLNIGCGHCVRRNSIVEATPISILTKCCYSNISTTIVELIKCHELGQLTLQELEKDSFTDDTK